MSKTLPAGDEHCPRVMLVTGGCGFIGANFIRWMLLRDPATRIVNLDALTYSGNPANLADAVSAHAARYRFVHGDIADHDLVRRLLVEERVDTIVHLAAESHVDRSIEAPDAFLHSNVTGTYVLLTAARAVWQGRQDVRFHHVSTDEVFGSLGPTGFFSETTAYDPSSPYSATKAASDHLVRAWHRTFGLPVTISNCSNNYGPFQFPEKLIPHMILKALAGEAMPIYGDGGNVRDWLYVEGHCAAIDRIVRRAKPGALYTVGGRSETSNLTLVHHLCDLLDELHPGVVGSYRNQITFVTDRPGHDRRYAIDPSRLECELGWSAAHTLASGLRDTVRWYLRHGDWIDGIRAARYDGRRLGLDFGAVRGDDAS